MPGDLGYGAVQIAGLHRPDALFQVHVRRDCSRTMGLREGDCRWGARGERGAAGRRGWHDTRGGQDTCGRQRPGPPTRRARCGLSRQRGLRVAVLSCIQHQRAMGLGLRCPADRQFDGTGGRRARGPPSLRATGGREGPGGGKTSVPRDPAEDEDPGGSGGSYSGRSTTHGGGAVALPDGQAGCFPCLGARIGVLSRGSPGARGTWAGDGMSNHGGQ
jgi:hypothetical protein